jgi:hypothetical protein
MFGQHGLADVGPSADRINQTYPSRAITCVAIGAIAGLAWAAGFRAYMAELAGPSSVVGWGGTFFAVLLPGLVTGGLLGWAEHLRRIGGRPRWRWLAAAPIALAVAPMLMPGAFVTLLTTGLGGGAVGVAIIALGGGYALSGRGPRWPRVLCAVLSGALLVGFAVATPAIGGSRLALTEPRGAWVAVLVTSFLVVLTVAAAIPHRPITTRPGAHRTGELR